MIGGTDRGMNFNKLLGSLGIPEDATFPIDEQESNPLHQISIEQLFYISIYRDTMIYIKTFKEVPNLECLSQAAECLRALAHPMRLKMLFLVEENRWTVGEIAKSCSIRSHVASEHLRLMQRCGMLSVEKEGQKAYYQICESQVHSILACMREKFSQS